MKDTFVEAILAHAEEIPDKLALGFKTITLNYAQLAKAMRQAGWILQKKYGINRGDRVMLSGVSKPDYVVALLGIHYIGAISIPIDKTTKEDNLRDLAGFIEPKALITDLAYKIETLPLISLKTLYAEAMGDLSEAADFVYEKPEDMNAVSEMLFTTGTTGRPKGGMLTYRSTYASSVNNWHGVNMEPADIILLPLPLNHSVGMRELRTAFQLGATIIIQNGFTFAKELENNINRFGCTALISVPASLEMVYRQMQDQFVNIMGRLRYMEIGAGSLGYDMKKKLVKILPNTRVYNTWGSTETGGAIFLNVTDNPTKYAALGKPVEGVTVKVVDPVTGEEKVARDIDTAGRLAVHGDMAMAGYYNLPEETAKTVDGNWIFTNDLVYTDEDGFVYMLGRADDIINVGGEKVSPLEIENIAQEFDEIKECACIGVKDPDGVLGQIPLLYLVPEGTSVNLDELRKYLATRMEKFKLPQKFLTLEELPRNRMKKLDRKALYRMWEENGDSELINPVIQNMISRHSIRDFKEQEIPRANLEMIIKAAIHAPSDHNMQTWKFTVIQNKEVIEKLRAVIKEAADRNKVYFYGFVNPDTVILVSNDKRNKHAVQDSSCAAENMQLAAWSYGIGSSWNNALSTICDDEQVRPFLTSLGVPENHIVWSTLVMGYPANNAKALAKKENVVTWID